MCRIVCALALLCTPALADPLPSWRDTETKAAIVGFVEAVTDPGSPDYVTQSDRIAVFDNDGTLWAEQPVYFQLLYAIDRLQAAAEADPSVLTNDTRRAAAGGDLAGALAGGEEGLIDLLAVSHAGLSVEAFQTDVAGWLESAVHPQTGQPFQAMVYQPMLELLRYLRDEGFQTWIVSGGGVHFIRAFAADAYGIPPWQVVGSAAPTAFEMVEGAPTLLKQPGIRFIDDKAGKPVGIDAQIGQRPIFAGGNSDGDFEMLDYVTAGDGPRFGLIVHHTDAEREFAYDRDSHVGQLVRGLDEGPGKGWVIVDMAADWDRIWPAQ